MALGPLVLRLINTPEELIDDALAYLWVIALSLVFNAYIVTAAAVLRAYGRTPAILVLAIVVNLFDVLLLGVFVLVLELGVIGAALPSLLVRGIGVLILMRLLRSRTGVTMFRGTLPRAGAERRSLWAMMRLSIPTVLENGAYNLAIVATLALINVLGADAINARSYALTLTALVTGVILALAQGNETIVGWNVGEREVRRAKLTTLRTAAWTAVSAAVLAVALWYFAEPALSVFGASGDIVEMARGALAVSIVLLPLSAATTVVYSALRSAGDVIVPMLYSIVTSAVVLLPLAWLFVARFEMGLPGALLGAGGPRGGACGADGRPLAARKLDAPGARDRRTRGRSRPRYGGGSRRA